MHLKDKIKSLPTTPGVYMMKDIKNKVIYVGKAKNLINRVRSYFQSNSDERLYCQFLTKRVTDIDFLVTDTEKEALILENNLIKQFKPRFNINLRDDKTFVSIKIDLNKPFPYLRIVREIKKDGSLYFGPYSSTKSVRETIRYINDVLPLRKCSESIFKNRKRPCLYYQLHKCLGPCCNLINKETYKRLIDQTILILKGKNDDLIKTLKYQMEESAKLLRFEDAARIRDRIAAIEKTVEKQKIHSMKFVDRDVFGYKSNENEICVQAMFIRSGNLIDVSTYRFSIKYSNPEDAFGSFLNQFYNNNNFIPQEVIIPIETEDKAILEELLTDLKTKKVEVIKPQRGEKLKLLQMAKKNAENSLELLNDQDKKNSEVLNKVAKVLDLEHPPKTIECFDVSNISGMQAVGAMVVFKNGIPYKQSYRRYRIKEVMQANDFAMMSEILKRRYIKAQEKNDFPNLTIIDGGKGHINVALNLFKDLGIHKLNIIGIAKGNKKNKTIDHIYLSNSDKSISLESDSPELLFIQKIRDEAHRFANNYHKNLRKKTQFDFKSNIK